MQITVLGCAVSARGECAAKSAGELSAQGCAADVRGEREWDKKGIILEMTGTGIMRMK